MGRSFDEDNVSSPSLLISTFGGSAAALVIGARGFEFEILGQEMIL